MIKALYPGSFDPITLGHLDIIERASKMFDEVDVAIMHNPRKQCSFNIEERIAMIQKCTKHLPNVRVVSDNILTVDLAKKLGCKVLVRGIRAVVDYEYELAQASANMTLDKDIETVFLVAKPEYSFLSSSVAKEVAMFNGDISQMIPECIQDEVKNRLNKNV